MKGGQPLVAETVPEDDDVEEEETGSLYEFVWHLSLSRGLTNLLRSLRLIPHHLKCKLEENQFELRTTDVSGYNLSLEMRRRRMLSSLILRYGLP